jgi:tetratricopeptide (TPR) repeat protein
MRGVCSSLAVFLGRIRLHGATLIHGLLIAVVLGLSLITWQQLHLWFPSRREPRHILASRQRSVFLRAAFWAREGDRRFRGGDTDAALNSYRRALDIYPAYAEVYNNLGVVFQSRGMLNDAAREYRLAFAINPDFELPHRNLADILASTGQIDEAIAHYREALRINPRYTAAQDHLDLVLSRRAGPAHHD